MIGNQAIINQQLHDHPNNPIKEKIGDVEVMDILYVVTLESWKQWRRDLTYNESPHIIYPGLGVFDMMYGKSKSYLRTTLKKIRTIKGKYPDEYLVEGTRANSLYNFHIRNFKTTWKQVDQIKREVVHNLELWKQKKIAKYGDKAIL